jgi:taurine--2-oxoglutarate transaminase
MGTATVTASPTGVSWEDVKEWDERYYLRPFRSLDEYTHVAVDHGEGSYLVLADGTRILDFMSQYICANLGQSHPRIREAIVEAAHRFAYLSEPWASDYRSKAAKLIVEDVLGDEGWAGQVRFVATGSESIELALIMAKLYTGRPNVITQEFGYHGWTQGAAGTTGFRAQRANISSAAGDATEVPGYPPPEYHVVPAPTHYPGTATYGPSGLLTCVEETEEAIRRIGPDTIAAFVFDVAQGPGLHPPPEYVPQIRELLDRYGILWIDDEILTGFGRTGKWFGYQHHPGVTPDIMCCAKGMVGAAVPAAAVIVRSEIGEFFQQKRWWLPSTMAAHPLAMAAVVATIEALIEERIVENAARMGEYLGARLHELEARHRCVGHVDGIGLFWAVDLVRKKETGEAFVADRNSLAAGDLSNWPVPLVTHKCLEQGVFITGFSPNTLRIGPPLNTTETEIDEAMGALDAALTDLDGRCS